MRFLVTFVASLEVPAKAETILAYNLESLLCGKLQLDLHNSFKTPFKTLAS